MSFKQMGVKVTLEGLSFMESTCEVSYDGRLFQMVAEKWLNARLSLTRQFAKMTSWAWWFFNIDNWQGSLATCSRAVEYLNMILLQIYHWVCQRKNFENRLILGEFMGMSLVVCCFFWLTVWYRVFSFGRTARPRSLWRSSSGRRALSSDTDCLPARLVIASTPPRRQH